MTMSTQTSQTVAVIGAGLAGLTLRRCLKHKGIPAIIYERASSSPRRNYGITLQRSSYQALLGVLHLEDSTFREKLAIDAFPNGYGSLPPPPSSLHRPDDSFRCHRAKLELLLRESLDIRWSSPLQNISLAPQFPDVTAIFGSGERIERACLIGCDGVHSQVRQTLCPEMKVKVLPYVVFNGKRLFSRAEYQENVEPYMQGSALVQMRKDDIRLEISINEHTATTTNLSYTYSRPARDSQYDPLLNPGRSISGATTIPEDFYKELEQLEGYLIPPFTGLFNAEKSRKDRVLHWLMRSLMPNPEDAQRLENRGVILIGDAIHALPILGGEGANLAIKDGIALAEHIAMDGVVKGISSFSKSRHEIWKQAVIDSEERITKMHGLAI